VDIVRVRFEIFLRLPARKTLKMDGMEIVRYVSEGLVWVLLGARCVVKLGGVL
jgi:hypothetical protein